MEGQDTYSRTIDKIMSMSTRLTMEDVLKTYDPHPLQEVVDYMVKKEEIKDSIKHLLPMLHIE